MIMCKYHLVTTNSTNEFLNRKDLMTHNPIPCRTIFKLPFKPPLPSSSFGSKVKRYRERRVLG